VTSKRLRSNDIAIWIWLIVLMIVGLLVTLLPLDKSTAMSVIFAIAAVKAALVALNYMHLKSESWLICALAIVPVLLVVALTLVLLPDVVIHH